MTTSKPSQLFQKIKPEIERKSRDFHRNVLEKGFLHWAISEILADEDLTDEIIADNVIIDGAGDLGIDAFWVDDETNKVVHIFQAKYRGEPGKPIDEKEVDSFQQSLERVLNPTLVAESPNEGVKELFDNLVRLIPQNYVLHLVFVTDGSAKGRVSNFKREPRNTTRVFNISGKDYHCRVEVEVCDLQALVSLYEEHSTGPKHTPTVSFDLSNGWFHELLDPFRVIDFTIHASQLIEAFKKYDYAILRLNPRGPLRSKVNREIRRSLEDNVKRSMFHILNNGITAICASWRRKGTDLEVDDFQIVNGCQTIYTLWRARSLVTPQSPVLIDVKLVECPQAMHREIAVATNNQSRLKVEDLVSTDPIQIALKKEFDSMQPPWFYELKRGEWRFETPPDIKERYETEQGYRLIRMKEAAQATLAFLGKPGIAKDRPRLVFERRLNGGNYEEVFGEGISALQLLLSVLIYRLIQSQVAAEKSAPDWLEYSRLHLCWLTGELIRERYNLPPDALPQKGLAEKLISTARSWVPEIYGIAKEAIGDAVEDSQREQTYRGPREFFRSDKHYPRILSSLKRSLERERRTCARRGEGDPLTSTLPSYP